MQQQYELSRYVALVIIGGLTAWYWYVGHGHVSYTMDSLTYRDVALNIVNGNGLVTTNTFDTTPQFVPLLQWPGAYPAIWAGMVGLGLDIDMAPRILSPMLYVATLALVFLLGAKLTKSNLAGAMAAFVYVALPTGLAIFNFAWSETLFIPLTLVAFVALLQYADAQGHARMAYLWIAASCIGIANWTRYTGVVFLPLVAISVWLMTEGSWARKLRESALTLALSMSLVAPLWTRNYIMTGMISGSSRGGHTEMGAAERLAYDIQALWKMAVYPLFNFDTVLYALVGLPLLALVALAIFVSREKLLKPTRPTFLAMLWTVTILSFLLYARVIQQGVDFDYRMLAIPAPFAIVAGVALLAERPKLVERVLHVALIVMLSATLISEGQRVHENLARKSSPGWRALSFGITYVDLSKGYERSNDIALPAIADNAAILTDYRGLYMRYLTNHLAYQVVSADNCARLMKNLQVPLVFVVARPKRSLQFDIDKTPTAKCAEVSSHG